MVGTKITVDGLDDLRRDLRRVKDRELDDEMKKIHADLAKDIERLAAPMVPVQSGTLLASLRSSGTVKDAIGRAGKASVPYAPPIHWGWPAHGIRGAMFMARASDQLEQGIVDRYDRAVAGMLDRVIR